MTLLYLLTEKMINEAIEQKIKSNEKIKNYKIRYTPKNKRHILFLEYLKKDYDLCMDIIYSGLKIPFYLMTKKEFTEIINFFNKAKKKMNIFDYSSLTVEQIIRLLKEVNKLSHEQKI